MILVTHSCTYCLSSFSDSKALLLLQEQLELTSLTVDLYSISRHNHFFSFFKSYFSCNVCCSDVELWLVSFEEWCVSSSFFFLKEYTLHTQILCVELLYLALKALVLVYIFFLRPRKRIPALSPAIPESRDLLNISIPVTVDFTVS
jgi:hypothetical protein